MDDFIKTRSTSRASAWSEDIELRRTSKTLLVFRPEIVDNPHDHAASVKGTFIFQVKKPSGNWDDYKTIDLNRLRDNEWIKLELKSEEVRTLFLALERRYELFKQHGIKPGIQEFIVTPRNTKEVILGFLRNPENFAKLRDLKVEDLKQLTVVANLNSLKTVIQVWEEHSSDPDETFWQNFFKEYSWVIAQVFAAPVVLFKDKAYVGGKTLDNRGGSVADFLFRSRFTQNVLIVEIKTPVTPLLGNEYREGAYRFSNEVSGSISQILKYKHELQTNYTRLQTDAKFTAFDPKCLILVGNISGQLHGRLPKTRSFALLRNDSRNVAIVAYDELIEKVQLLVRLLEK